MKDFDDAELLNLYSKQSEQEIEDLKKLVVVLRAKIASTEEQLRLERESREKIPLPKTVVRQIIELEQKVRSLTEDVAYLEKYVPEEVIINRKSKKVNMPSRKGSGLR